MPVQFRYYSCRMESGLFMPVQFRTIHAGCNSGLFMPVQIPVLFMPVHSGIFMPVHSGIIVPAGKAGRAAYVREIKDGRPAECDGLRRSIR